MTDLHPEQKNSSPFTRPGVPEKQPPDAGELARAAMHKWASWSIDHHDQFTYTEGAMRWHMVESSPGTLPQYCDCSAFVTGLAKWAGASDPNGLAYRGGFTGTLLTHCNRITSANARMGDLIVYGPGTGDHVVLIMERLPKGEFVVASHGHPGDPGRYMHSKLLAYFDGSARFLRWLS